MDTERARTQRSRAHSPQADVPGNVSVIIVNWNGGDYLFSCLAALRQQTLRPAEVVVVDNASADGSAAVARERFPEVRMIQTGANLGFAAGVNVGLRSSTGQLVALLNPDAVPEPGWLEALVDGIEQGHDVGMAASLMLFADQPDVINSAGIALNVLGIAWDYLGGASVSAGLQPQEVFGPCAGAALYRRDMLEQLGGFDEDFFMYLEDVDLAWRAQAAGWRCRYVPGARVYHAHSASAGEGSDFKNFYKARNKVWLVAKNYPWPQLALWGPLILAYDVLAVAFVCRHGQLAPLRGRIAALRGLGHVLGKRRLCADRKPSGWFAVRRLMWGVEGPRTIAKRYAHLATRVAR